MPTFREWSLQSLRDRAETVADGPVTHERGEQKEMSVETMHKMLHELQVHQVELEMQNDQLRHTQLELDGARARYFDLYDLAPVGYCTVDENGRILEANFTAASMLDAVRSDLVQQAVSRFIVQSDQDTYYRCRKALFAQGLPQDCELQMLTRGGAPLWVHLRLSAAQDRSGAPVQRMVLCDTSERKRMDAALQTQNQELETARAVAGKANQAKSDFLSNMTHELRSPLNAILGFAQLIDQGQPQPTAAQKIGEILDLASIEAGKLALTLEPIAVVGVMLDCQTLMESQAQQKGVTMHFLPLTPPLWVVADATRLKQVIVNLLSNAIKYNTTGGSLEVSCERQTGGRLRISVRDTGFGLSPENIAQLFQPFNRLGQEARAEEGTGIGLAVSKRLVELMDGTMGADSTVGVGSVFWFELNLVCAVQDTVGTTIAQKPSTASEPDMSENTAHSGPQPPTQGDTP